MQSKEKKIKRLIESSDTENQNLGCLTLESALNKDNVLYWYMTLEPIKNTINESVYSKMSDILGWSAYTPALESLFKMADYIKTNRPSIESIEKFFTYYNEYLYNSLSHTWTTADRVVIKSQIPQLNVSTTPTKSHEDL